jgi:hypothetical protein
VHSVRSWGRWAGKAAILGLLTAAPHAQAANDPLAASPMSEPVQARFDPVTRQTVVIGATPSDGCFSFSLPNEWRMSAEGLTSAVSDVQVAIGLRSAQELRGMPQPDLVSRDAAFLQRDYEEMLGRPAQSVSLTSTAGATRWSATWIDANLPTASKAMTVETLIVPLSSQWVLELSLTGIESREAYDALAQQLLARLKLRGGALCQG